MKEFYITDDGIRLHAKLDMPEETTKCPLVIIVHGYTGDMEEAHLTAIAGTVNEIGMAALRVEMYGHGQSDGAFFDHTLYKWVGNLLCVVRYAKKLDFVTDLYLAGHSQGGLLTMLVGGMCPRDFKAILPLSPAWMIPEEARAGRFLGSSFDPQNIPEEITQGDYVLGGDYMRVAQTIHVEDEISRYKGPVLIVHGDADETVPYEYGLKAQKLYHNARLATIPGDTHCYDHHIDLVCEEIRKFLCEPNLFSCMSEIHRK